MTTWIIAGVVAVLVVLLLMKLRADVRAPTPLPPEGERSEADVRRLISMGRKIEAIKVYREIHAVGLKEAKEAVEQLEREIPRSPR